MALEVEQLDRSDRSESAAAPKKKAAKKSRSRSSSKFSEGDDVLIAVKHLHGTHATVLHKVGDAFALRINEHQYEGFLVIFGEDELELVRKGDLDKHASARLSYDRYQA